MKHDKKLIEKIAIKVQTEYQMAGLADGLYLDFATDVAIRYANAILPQANVIKSVCECGKTMLEYKGIYICEYCRKWKPN